jgi:hypothetical protein
VNPCRGSQASLVANLRAHEYADFVSFLLLQINFLGRESFRPRRVSTYPINVPRSFPRHYPGLVKPGAARELQFKSHFKGESFCFFGNSRVL